MANGQKTSSCGPFKSKVMQTMFRDYIDFWQISLTKLKTNFDTFSHSQEKITNKIQFILK